MKKCFALFLTLLFFASNVSFAMINDDFVNETLNKSFKIPEYQRQIVKDDLITQVFVKEHKNESYGYNKKVLITDDLVEKNLLQYKNAKLVSYVPIDFGKLQKTTLKIKPKENITTKDNKIREGLILSFILAEDFSHNNINYLKGTEVQARIEKVSLNQSLGVPADVEIGNFEINGLHLDGNLKIEGANRAIWVLPVAYIGCCFFGAGLLIMPIRGGHAKLNKDKTYTLVVNK